MRTRVHDRGVGGRLDEAEEDANDDGQGEVGDGEGEHEGQDHRRYLCSDHDFLRRR